MRKREKRPAKNDTQAGRMLWLGGVMGVLLMVLFVGLVVRQLVQYDYFHKLEERQSLRRVLLPAPRGIITDRNGLVLAKNKPVFSLIVYLGELRAEFRRELIRLVRQAREKEQIVDRETLQQQAMQNVLQAHLQPLQRILSTDGQPIALDLKKIERHLYEQPLMPYTLLNNLSLTQFAKLTEMLRVDAPLQLQIHSLRTYPEGDTASHVLGFVAMRDPDMEAESEDDPHPDLRTFSDKEQQGINGVEKYFDDSLSGQMGHELLLVNPAGFRYDRTEHVAAVPGQPLTLTIDTRFQKTLEKSFGKKIGAAVALDVNTGEVLALVSKPSFNPNELVPNFNQATNAKINVHNGWMDRAIQGLYPPGSTFKLMTTMAALENNELGLDETIDCPAFLEVGGRKFHEHRKTGYGEVNLVRALEVSCDVFYYQVGLRTGPDAIAAEAQKYGLGKTTGIELPGESTHTVLPTPAWKKKALYEPWYAGDTANMAIGQGYVLLTPTQMACMAASIARGDTITTPTLVKKDNPPILARKPYSENLAKVIEGMKAVTTTGTGRLVHVDGLQIAGKTGTAQVKVRGENLTLAWFVGFAPVDNPQVAIAVVVEGTSPDDEYEGGTIAAPLARSFFEEWKKDTLDKTPAVPTIDDDALLKKPAQE